MKNLLYSFVWLSFALFGFSKNTNATHITGVDFSYECVGQDSFLITLNIYRDCSGIQVAPNVGIAFSSTCGGSVNSILTKQNGVNGTEVSQICPASISNSTCNGGAMFGIQQHIFSGIVVLTSPCDTWSMEFSNCCRNSSINMGNTSVLSINATLNSATDSCNSSPVFLDPPRSTVCVHQLVDYNLNVYEPDGDSLVYSFVIPNLPNPGTAFYSPGYSVASPIPGVTLNSANGQLTFTPFTLGLFIMAIQVCEYEYGTGLLKGCVVRDFQFYSINCSNTVTLPPTLGITNLSGNATLIGTDTLEICSGNSFSFDLTFGDPDTADIVTITSNVTAVMPGSVVSYSGINPKTMSVFWTLPSGTPPAITLNVTATDSACPISGVVTKVYTIIILDGTDAGFDQSICQGTQWAQLGADGGSIFSWSVLSGSAIDTVSNSSSYNMTCSTCQYPQVSPSLTTAYVVTSNLTGTCVVTDTVLVNVAPDFNLTMPNDTLICPIDDLLLQPSINQSFTYGYLWSPSNSLNTDTIEVPLANPSIPTNYQLTVTSSMGCEKTGSVFVDVSSPFPPNMQVIGDTVLCVGESTQLGIDFGEVPITNCGLSTQGCIGITQNGDVGTGIFMNTGSTFPSIYGGSKNGAKHQILYKASELQSLGMTSGGVINSIAFYVNSIGAISAYDDFEIKAGCTPQTNMVNGWVTSTNMTVVVPSYQHNVTVGWNVHNFTIPYNWDGQSSLVFEICFANNSNMTNANCIMPNTMTGLPMVVYQSANNTTVCPMYYSNTLGGASITASRPNTRFNFCSGVDPSVFTYFWLPNGTLSNGVISNPLASPAVSTFYQVIVTDNSGICIDTLDIFVDMVTQFNAGFVFNDPYCITDGPDQANPNVGGGFFTGVAIDSNGWFYPDSAGIGSHSITYHLTTPALCANDSVINVTVIPLPDASINYTEICLGSSQVTLNAATSGGVWSGVYITDTINGVFDATGLAAGTYQVTYELNTPCYNTDTIGIRVVEPYNFTFNQSNPTVCQGDMLDLSNMFTLSNNPLQGSGAITELWSDNVGAVSPSGMFDASNVSTGLYTVYLSISDANGNCGVQKSLQVNVLKLDIPQFPNGLSFCDQSTSAIINVIPWLFGNGASFTQSPLGLLTPNDTLNIVPFGPNGKFNPSTLGIGNWQITVSYTNLNGCTGVIVDTIHVLTSPDTTVTQSAAGLTATATGGYTYQWIDCSTNLPIAGATNQTYAPGNAGNYAVIISAGSCEGTSGCHYSTAVGVKNFRDDLGITIHPNPTEDLIFIDNSYHEQVKVEVIDFTGKLVYSGVLSIGVSSIDMSEFASGMYLVKLHTETEVVSHKILKR